MSIRLGETEVQEYLNMTVYEGGSVDLSNYYTKSEVDGMISNIDVSGQLKNYALKTDIPSLEGYATESYVNSKITALVNTAPEALDTLNELSLALGNDPNFATTIATNLGLKANSSDVYVKSEVYNKNEMDRIIESLEIDGSTDLSGYAKLTDIPTKTSQLTNDSGFLTESSLENYALKDDLPVKTSQLTNDSGFITSESLSGYATESWVEGKNYLTTQDISTLETKQDASNKLLEAKNYTETKIAGLVGAAPEALNTIYELADAIERHEDSYDALLETVGNKANKSTTLSGYGITNAYTKTEVDNKIPSKTVKFSGTYEDGTSFSYDFFIKES